MRDYLNHIIWFSLIMAVTLLSSCSNVDSPVNLEPRIFIGEASDITRTSSVISAKIETPGTVSLSYLRFYYGEKDNINLHSADLTINSDVVSFELKNLKPGTEYFYYAEGGTITATLRSETRSFKTIPNDKPKVLKAEPLSTGPTGIIVEFIIEDDGGEPLIESGCIVTETAINESHKVLLPNDKLTEGPHLLYITGLNINTTYSITPFAVNSSGESLSEPLDYTTRPGIVLHQAGMLRMLLGDKVSLSSLTLSGDLNGTDIRFLRTLTGAPALPSDSEIHGRVTELNLADANIVTGGDTYDGSRHSEDNILSTGIFSDCVDLRTIVLPNSSIAIKRNAFSRCTSLETLTIPMNVTELIPSEQCTELKEISVSPANNFFKSIDGVLFNRDITEILWFPLGKTGHYSLPSSLTSIGENAFMGTHITSLAIPSSVKVIHRGAFSGSELKEIILPDDMTNISEGMFQNCNKLTSVHLGRNTEFIGNYVFDGTYLKDLYIAALIPPYASEDAFVNYASSMFENCTLHVPVGYRNNYRNHAKWKQFNNIVEF